MESQCFKSSWMLALLHAGYEIPKTTAGDDTFQSVNEIGIFSVSWTLGSALFHACSIIPPSSGGSSLLAVMSSTRYVLFLLVCIAICGTFVCNWKQTSGGVMGSPRRRDLDENETQEFDSLVSVVVDRNVHEVANAGYLSR